MNGSDARQKLIIVSGPTASGKSRLAEALAAEFDGEIVSCDSMQVYRTLDIGTAKPSAEERKRTRYHLVDITDIDTPFTLADYIPLAEKAIEDISSRGKMPILCGGTGLYIENIIHPTALAPIGSDDDFRASLEVYTDAELGAMLKAVDAVSAEKIHQNNRKRVVRALEIYHLTGKPKSEWDAESRKKACTFDLSHITLVSRDRGYLYGRIDKRVDTMMASGLLAEAEKVSLSGCPTASQAIGYKEFAPYFSGEKTLGECVARLRQSTKNYAKRQLTWFSRYRDALMADISDERVCLTEKAAEYVKRTLKEQ